MDIKEILDMFWKLQKSVIVQGTSSYEYNKLYTDFLHLHIAIRNKNHSISFLKRDCDIDRESYPDFLWIEKHQLLDYYAYVLSDNNSYPTWLKKYNISNTIDYSAKYLYGSCDNFNHYYLKWLYLVLLQISKNYKRTYFSSLPNTGSIENYVNDLLTEVSNASTISSNEDTPTNKSFKTWLIPAGVLYKTSIPIRLIGDTESIVLSLYDEITYIRANYQMCKVYEYDFDTEEMFSRVQL